MSSEQTLTKQELKKIVEAVVFASPAPISIEKIQSLVFAELNIKKMEIEDVLPVSYTHLTLPTSR